MSASSFTLFNFYKRYKWRAADFETLQTSIFETIRAVAEGLAKSEIVDGFEFVGSTGMNLEVASGIAFGASGNLLGTTESEIVSLTPPTTNPKWDLVVARPKLTNEEYIVRPTVPFDSVPLEVKHETEVVVISGTESVTPSYPAKQANDVVLFGVKMPGGISSLQTSYLDLLERDRLGKNSDLGGLSQYDFICGMSHPLATHVSLKQLLSDSNLTAGSKILVHEDESLDSTLTIDQDDLEIDFAPGVTLDDGGAGVGISVEAEGLKLRGGRFTDFTTAISIEDGFNKNMILESRFSGCTNDVTDNNTSPNNVVSACITE